MASFRVTSQTALSEDSLPLVITAFALQHPLPSNSTEPTPTPRNPHVLAAPRPRANAAPLVATRRSQRRAEAPYKPPVDRPSDHEEYEYLCEVTGEQGTPASRQINYNITTISQISHLFDFQLQMRFLLLWKGVRWAEAQAHVREKTVAWQMAQDLRHARRPRRDRD